MALIIEGTCLQLRTLIDLWQPIELGLMHDATFAQPLQIHQLLICLQTHERCLPCHVQITARARYVCDAVTDTVSASIQEAISLCAIRPKCHVFWLVGAGHKNG